MSATEPVADSPRAAGPTYPDTTPRRAAKHRIADHLRDLVRAVSQLEVEEADTERLAELEQRLADARELMAALPDLSRHGGASGSPGPDGNLLERSPLTGRGNPLAAPLYLEMTADATIGHATYHEGYQGPPGAVHGGVVVAAFDDLLGVAQAASGMAGPTATLTVQLRRPTPLHERIDYHAEVERVEGRKITAVGRATHRGELLAEATGLFIAPRDPNWHGYEG